MMTRNLGIELGPLGITINNVAPGAIETPINTKLLNDPEKLGALLQNISLGRLGQPQDISSLVAFLASEEANYITGSTFVVDGGLLWNYQEQQLDE
jgi:glucose 1-dehydrogenase